jgi:outer membrane lipoprotein-sorting protein
MTKPVDSVTGFADLEVFIDGERYVAASSVFFKAPSLLRLDLRDPFGRIVRKVFVVEDSITVMDGEGRSTPIKGYHMSRVIEYLDKLNPVDVMGALAMTIPPRSDTGADDILKLSHEAVLYKYARSDTLIEVFVDVAAARIVRKRFTYPDNSSLDITFSDFTVFRDGTSYPSRIVVVQFPFENRVYIDFRKVKINVELSPAIFTCDRNIVQ